MAWTKAEDEFLIRNYQRLDVDDIAAVLGKSKRNVISRRHVLGCEPKFSQYSNEEIATIKAWYAARDGKPLQLDLLAKKLGRSKPNVCRKAKALGLTDQRRLSGRKPTRKYPTDEESRAAIVRGVKNHQAKYGHPRGMAGKKHSEKTKKRLAKTSKARWDAMTADEQSEFIAGTLKSKLNKNGTLVPNTRQKATWKAGWRKVGDQRCYFRSAWEANYARYLEMLKSAGAIEKWEHEPKTFWFENIKRGVRSYLPDFHVTENDSSEHYCEVKGWMDARSKTKIKRMKKYYPDVDLRVINGKQYRSLAKQVAHLIPGWE